MPIGNTVPLTAVRWDDVLFLVLAGMLLGSALLVVTMRDIIRCGLALIASFASLAGIYVLLGNPLVAAAQVLVYIGAISVLVLFAIMLTQTKNAPTRLAFQTQAWAAAIAAVAIATTADVARTLFRDYVLPFEAVSVLLTAAVIGAVYLARNDSGRAEEDEQ
jgi:NADH-quinone oxidoreductase subunit J